MATGAGGWPMAKGTEHPCPDDTELTEVEVAELVRYAKDSSPYSVVSKLWRRFLALQEAAQAVSDHFDGEAGTPMEDGRAAMGRLREFL